METSARIEHLLRERFRPSHFELVDESARHAGHPGAASGGGHYRLTLVSAEFEESGRLARHRAVHEALGGLIGTEIHALSIRAVAPSEWVGEDDGRALT